MKGGARPHLRVEQLPRALSAEAFQGDDDAHAALKILTRQAVLEPGGDVRLRQLPRADAVAAVRKYLRLKLVDVSLGSEGLMLC